MTFPFCSRCGRRLPAPAASPRQCAGCQLSHPDPVTSIHDRKQTTMIHQNDNRDRVKLALGHYGYDTACANHLRNMEGRATYDLRRAGYGQAAVLAGTPDFGLNDDETDCVDALANLLHYADRIVGADIDRLIGTARMHFDAERWEA